MERTKLSLKWLEVFQAVSTTGSVQEASKQLGLSVSTVSHHLACLEQAVGVPLVDHSKRPMMLTMAGETLRQRVDESIMSLRKGMAEVRSNDPETLIRRLRIASIEDFDMEVMPFLAMGLMRKLPACDLSFLSRPSHDVMAMLQSEEVDIGIASEGGQADARPVEMPLLRDPFVLVAPREHMADPSSYLAGTSGLTFLRYSKKQLMGRRVEAQLRRMRKPVASQLEFESTQPILSLVAERQGWTITTALNFAGAYRHHAHIHAMPLPEAGFVRNLFLFSREDLPRAIAKLVGEMLQPLIQKHIIEPALEHEPWLLPEFRLLSAD